MKVNYILPVLSSLGLVFAVYSTISGNQTLPIAAAIAQPASAPYASFIAGSGIVEASSQNIAIGAPVSRLVTQVAVQVGDKVKLGQALFYLDNREVLAEKLMREADVAKAKAELGVARASQQEAQTLFDLLNAVSDARAINAEDKVKRQNTLLVASARTTSAQSSVQQAEAALANVHVLLERLIIRAPIAGEILQVNVRPGEFAVAGSAPTPLILLGNLDAFHVRVDIDENDVWRFSKKGKAIAYLRGNRTFKTDLSLAYIEPFVVPKKSLTGDSTERVDTRVLQVLYQFSGQQYPVYVGQQMDVFIETFEDPNN